MNSSDTPAVPEILGVLPDLQTKVTSSVSGFVTDHNDAPVVGAEVKAGSATAITDRYGYFEIKNVQVIKEAATVTVSYTGYFKAIKTYMATEGKAAFFRIKLLQKTIIGTIDASAGGNVSLSNGLNISFPSNAIKDSNGNTYNGTVNVAAQYLDPTSPELNNTMPGDLRGINTDGFMKGLTSFGMMGVELTGNSGELMQIADGKKSTITMPLPAAIASSAPPTIPLWHFDESNGLWKQEGTATKNGNIYVGEVSHFSWWNVDLPNATIPLSFTVVDTTGKPIANIDFEILPLTSNSWSHIFASTDQNGYVQVPVTANTQYRLQILSPMRSPVLTKIFTVENNAVSLGNIIVGAYLSTLRGTVADCSNNALLNAKLILNDGYHYWIQYTGAGGSFEFSTFLPDSNLQLGIIAEDPVSSQQSQAVSYLLSMGSHTIGNIQACGVSTDTYLNFTINGRTFIQNNQYINNCFASLTSNNPDSNFTALYWTSLETHNSVAIPNSTGNIYFSFLSFGDPRNNLTPRFAQWIRPFNNVFYFSMHGFPLSYYSHDYREIPMNITEYGDIGGFIAGSFSGRFYEEVGVSPDLTRPYEVSCNFRVRRNQ